MTLACLEILDLFVEDLVALGMLSGRASVITFFVDELEFEERDLLDEGLGRLRLGQAGQLYEDVVMALADDFGLGQPSWSNRLRMVSRVCSRFCLWKADRAFRL